MMPAANNSHISTHSKTPSNLNCKFKCNCCWNPLAKNKTPIFWTRKKFKPGNNITTVQNRYRKITVRLKLFFSSSLFILTYSYSMQSSSETSVVWLSRMLRHIILVTVILLLLYRTLCIVLQRLQYGENSVEKQQQQRNYKNSSKSESERDKLKCRELLSTKDHQDQAKENRRVS